MGAGVVAATLSSARWWLLLLVLGVGTSLWLAGQQRSRPPVNAAAETDFLLAGGEQTLLRLELATADGTVTLERGDDGWRDAEPLPADADPTARRAFIAARIKMLAVARVERRFAADTREPAQFGISADSARALLKTRDGPVTLRIGALTPDGFGRYLWHQERNEFLTIPTYQVTNLLRLLPADTVLPPPPQ